MSAPNTAVEEREDVTATSSRSPKTTALIVKIILVGLVDALLILAFAKTVSAEWWLAAVFFAAVFVAVNFVYFTGRALPFKYLLPGLVFLVAFQFYTMVFTGYASFTNYGGEPPGRQGRGDHVHPGVERGAGPGWRVVPGGADRQGRHGLDAGHRPRDRGDQHRHQRRAHRGRRRRAGQGRRHGHRRQRLRVASTSGRSPTTPTTTSSGRSWRSPSTRRRAPTSAPSRSPRRRWPSPASSTTRTRTRWSPRPRKAWSTRPTSDDGNFINEAGERLQPGWKVNVGFANYTKLFTDETLRVAVPPDHRVDVLLRDRHDVPELLARADAGDGAQRPADARAGDLPAAADRPLRAPGHLGHPDVEGDAQLRLRVHQPGAREPTSAG